MTQLIGVQELAAELLAIVREYGLDRDVQCLEEGHHIGVQQMHGGQRHLAGVEPAQVKREQQSMAVLR